MDWAFRIIEVQDEAPANSFAVAFEVINPASEVVATLAHRFDYPYDEDKGVALPADKDAVFARLEAVVNRYRDAADLAAPVESEKDKDVPVPDPKVQV